MLLTKERQYILIFFKKLIISKIAPEDEYYTMSATKVVHVRPNYPTETYTLSEWQLQSVQLKMLATLPFFRQFLLRKPFNIWRSAVRMNLYSKTRRIIKKKLLWSKPSFVKSLQNVYHALLDLKDFTRLSLVDNHIYNNLELFELYKAKLSSVSVQLLKTTTIISV